MRGVHWFHGDRVYLVESFCSRFLRLSAVFLCSRKLSCCGGSDKEDWNGAQLVLTHLRRVFLLLFGGQLSRTPTICRFVKASCVPSLPPQHDNLRPIFTPREHRKPQKSGTSGKIWSWYKHLKKKIEQICFKTLFPSVYSFSVARKEVPFNPFTAEGFPIDE